jgi:hypothetical protein
MNATVASLFQKFPKGLAHGSGPYMNLRDPRFVARAGFNYGAGFWCPPRLEETTVLSALQRTSADSVPNAGCESPELDDMARAPAMHTHE